MTRRGLLSGLCAWALGCLGRRMPEANLIGPYVVSPDSPWASWIQPDSPSMGPYANGSDLYAIFKDSGGTPSESIYKSSDGGVAWALLLELPVDGDRWFHAQKGATSVIRMLRWGYIDGDYRILLYEFDMDTDELTVVDDTDTWSPVSVHGYWDLPLWYHYNSVTEEDQAIYQGSDSGSSGGDTSLYVRRYRSGAWQAPQKIVDAVAGNNTWRFSLCADSDGITHVFAITGDFPGGNTVVYLQLAADGSEGATSDVHTIANTQWLGRSAIIGDTVVLPIPLAGQLLAGSPLSAPTFSLLAPFDADSVWCEDTAASTNAVGHTPSATGRLWWAESYINGPSWEDVDRLMSCTYDGTTLGTPEVVHDEWNYPSFPADFPDPADQMLQRLCPPAKLPTGQWGICIAMFTADGTTSFYFRWGAPAAYAIMAEAGSIMLGAPGFNLMI